MFLNKLVNKLISYLVSTWGLFDIKTKKNFFVFGNFLFNIYGSLAEVLDN